MLCTSVTRFLQKIPKIQQFDFCYLAENGRFKNKLNFNSTRKLSTGLKEASIYIHWPYCARRCSYCNFNKYIKKNTDTTKNDRMKRCLVKELDYKLQYAGVERVTSIFFGGGTPSLMDPDVIEAITSRTFQVPGTRRGIEVTLEANPSDISENKLDGFMQAGINRLSMGFQALDDGDLKSLNRDHNLEQGLKALNVCISKLDSKGEDAGKLKSLSVDLIFGRPGQSLQDWQDELQTFVSKFPEVPHISLYQLTLERGTQLWKDISKGLTKLPQEDEMADMYEAAVEQIENSNFHRYEVSNFSRTPHDESVHNWNYWNGGDYIGIGPGAHSRFWPKISEEKVLISNFREAHIQTLEPDPWMYEVDKNGHATRKIEFLKNSEIILSELLATSLRTRNGLTETIWNQTWSKMFRNNLTVFENPPFLLSHLIDSDRKCRSFVSENILVLGNGLKLSPKGLNLLDFVLPYLINSLELCLKKL